MGTRISGRPTFGGLASGLDTNALLEGLLQIERQPLNRIEARKSEIANQQSLMRQLNSRLLALRDSARTLDNRNTRLTNKATSEEFLKYTSSSTNEDVVEVTATAGASVGDIQIIVDKLARGSRRFSTTYTAATASAAVALTQGQSVTISLPNADPDANPVIDATEIAITATDGPMSLSTLRDRINTSAGNRGKVRADVLQADEGEFQLVLTSTETGVPRGQLAISGDITLAPPAEDGSDDAQNAEFLLFGQSIVRQSNVIDDVLTGISLNLKGVAERDDNDRPITETVTVSVDAEAIAAEIEKFVDAYNDVMSFLDSQSKYNETTKTAGPLSGDFMLREVQRRLRDAASRPYAFQDNPNNPFGPGGRDAETDDPTPGGSISGVGIEVASGGRLRLNRERLEEVLAEDPNLVNEFLSGKDRAAGSYANQNAIDAAEAWNLDHPDNLRVVPEPDTFDGGFFTQIGEELESIVRSGDGLFAERDRLYEARLKTIDNSIDRFNSRLALREETLVQRFSALERIVSSLQNQQGFLSGLR
jgi:flagellar hook-associated protein 2